MIKGIFAAQQITKETINHLVNLGINTVFSSYRNLNEQVITELKKNKIQIFAEVSLFFMEDIWENYPQSRPIDQAGKLMERIHWYTGACPNQQDLRENKIQSIKLLLKSSGIDGILLDFIRYPCHWEDIRSPDIIEYCFCPICLEKFNKEVGGKPEGESWINWKCQQITDFVREIREILKTGSQHIELGMFTVPWQDDDFNYAMRRIIGQDVYALSRYVDIFCPMTYHKLSNKSASWIGSIVHYFDKATAKKILPSIQTMDDPADISLTELEQSLEFALQKPSGGVLVFYFEELLKNYNKVQVVKRFFEKHK